LVPMTGPFDDDRDEHKAIAQKLALLKPELEVCKIETTLTPRAVAHLLGNATLVVSMRLHGCVMAYAQRTPCVCLVYHPKLSGFSKTEMWPGAQLPSSIPERQGR